VDERPSWLWQLFSLPVGWRLWPGVALMGVYSLAAGLILEWFDVKPVLWGENGAILNGLVLGLLLAFRNNGAYDRWWEGRKLWGQLINDSRNLCLKVRASVEADAEEVRRFGTLVAGFAFALKQHLRGGGPLANIPGFEKDEARPAHVPLHVAGLVLDRLAAWRRAGKLDGYTALALDTHARALMDICGACERIRSTPIAPSYRTLLRHGIVLYLAAAPWYVLHEEGLWGIPVVMILAYFLLGIELVAESVEEPFGHDGDDLALDRYCETIRGSVGEVLGTN